jgi:hypothetical protein
MAAVTTRGRIGGGVGVGCRTSSGGDGGAASTTALGGAMAGRGGDAIGATWGDPQPSKHTHTARRIG